MNEKKLSCSISTWKHKIVEIIVESLISVIFFGSVTLWKAEIYIGQNFSDMRQCLPARIVWACLIGLKTRFWIWIFDSWLNGFFKSTLQRSKKLKSKKSTQHLKHKNEFKNKMVEKLIKINLLSKISFWFLNFKDRLSIKINYLKVDLNILEFNLTLEKICITN